MGGGGGSGDKEDRNVDIKVIDGGVGVGRTGREEIIRNLAITDENIQR